jgi:hypothetical protein
LQHPGAGAAQQEVIELVAAYRILPGRGLRGEYFPVQVKLVECHEAVRIVVRIELEILQGFRGYPARAQLGAWEGRPVQDQYVEAGLA